MHTGYRLTRAALTRWNRQECSIEAWVPRMAMGVYEVDVEVVPSVEGDATRAVKYNSHNYESQEISRWLQAKSEQDSSPAKASQIPCSRPRRRKGESNWREAMLLTAIIKTSDTSSSLFPTSSLHNLISNSSELQYYAALIPALAEDNPCSNLPASEKLEALRRSERAWWTLRPGFVKSVPVTHIQSGVYDLTAGVYFLSNSTRNSIHYIKLPTKETDLVEWQKIDANKLIVDIGLCLYEHDLMVLITSTQVEQHAALQPYYRIELQLLQFSTGLPHPDAQEKTIHVMNAQWEKPAVGIETVGDNLVLILTFSTQQRPEDRVFIYEWKTNTLKASWQAPFRSYWGFLFLTEDLILIPNTRTEALEIFRIPSQPTFDTPTPILVLKLPELADGRLYGGLSARCEPNPIGSNSRLGGRGSDPTRPFLASAEDAICIFDIRMLAMQIFLLPGGAPPMMNMGVSHRFTFIIHRKAFIDLVAQYARKDHTGHQIEAEGGEADHSAQDGAARDDGEDEQMEEEEVAHSLSEDEPPAPSNSQRESSSSPPPLRSVSPSEASSDEDDSSSSSRGSSPGPPKLTYSQWGPTTTRWFNADGVQTHWITTTAGQRCVQMADRGPAGTAPILVLDFNPAKVKEGLKLEERRRQRREERRRRRAEKRKLEEAEEQKAAEQRVKHILSEMRAEKERRRVEREMRREEGESEVQTWAMLEEESRQELASGSSRGEEQDGDVDSEGKDFLDRAMEDDDDAYDYIDTGNRIQDGRYQYDPTNPEAKPDPSSKFYAKYGPEAGPSSAGPSGPPDGWWNEDDDDVADVEDRGRQNAMQDVDTDEDSDGAMQVDDDDEGLHYLANQLGLDIDVDVSHNYDAPNGHYYTYQDLDDLSSSSHSSASSADGRSSSQPHAGSSREHEASIGTGSDEDRIRTISSLDIAQPSECFREPVLGCLPYVVCTTEEEYDFDGLLLDEERILGLKVGFAPMYCFRVFADWLVIS
ncbi:hypothetical protein CVT26_006634 [Gymnopilus dilepis]|uniref:Uncharacterized protein n=1 Tax=Gymnopilus dilepis TaxID=231916 RepID=A0A409Y2P3_9AGAR|nr:hypothetical protein CVT26_006634 [Gymnopilus dilepis]